MKEKNNEQDRRLETIEQHLDKVRTNELPHIREKITEAVTDLKWLKKAFWVVAGGIIGLLLKAMRDLMAGG